MFIPLDLNAAEYKRKKKYFQNPIIINRKLKKKRKKFDFFQWKLFLYKKQEDSVNDLNNKIYQENIVK